MPGQGKSTMLLLLEPGVGTALRMSFFAHFGSLTSACSAFLTPSSLSFSFLSSEKDLHTYVDLGLYSFCSEKLIILSQNYFL